MELGKSVRREIENLQAKKTEADRAVLGEFLAGVRKAGRERQGKIGAYRRQREKMLGDIRGKVEGLRKRVLECRKKLRKFKGTGLKEIEVGKRGMKEIRDGVVKEVDGVVEEFMRRGGMKRKSEELFRGLARLFGE